LVAVDRLFHHVREDAALWTSSETRPIGAGPLVQKFAAVEAVLHHLCFDVGVNPHDSDEAAPPPDGAEVAPPPAQR
jgi:hypothetical protein